MAKEDKWSVYMKDVEKHLCPLLHSKDPVKDCSRNAEDAGFEVTCCEVFRESWTYANKRVFRGRHLNDFNYKYNYILITYLYSNFRTQLVFRFLIVCKYVHDHDSSRIARRIHGRHSRSFYEA